MSRGTSTSVDAILYGENTLTPRMRSVPQETINASKARLKGIQTQAKILLERLDRVATGHSLVLDKQRRSFEQAKNAVTDLIEDRVLRELASNQYQELAEKYKHRSSDQELGQLVTAIETEGEDIYRQEHEQRLTTLLAEAGYQVDETEDLTS